MAEETSFTKEFTEYMQSFAAGLTKTERKLLPSIHRDGSLNMEIDREAYNWIVSLFVAKEGRTPSEIFRKQLSGLVEVCVEPEFREECYYALDEMNQFQMTRGLFRPSMRSRRYTPFIQEGIWLLWAYARLRFYRAALPDVLIGKADLKVCKDARDASFRYSGILAAKIDLGQTEAIQAVRDVLLGENNTLMITHELIRGIVKSKNTELYQVLADFLLAARLQEGVRQAVCETMDAGRAEAFLYLLQVVEEHDLIRYSSVKRAVTTWIGIDEPKSVERVTGKMLHLMGQCLRDPVCCEEQLKTDDSIAICCALWAKGFYDADEAVRAIQRLAENGNKHQLLVASYYVGTLPSRELQHKAAKKIWFTYPGDLELSACYLSYFLGDPLGVFTDLMPYTTCGCYRYGYAPSYDKGTAPRQITAHKLHLDEKEARQSYQILKEMYPRLQEKEIDLHPCMIPSWYRVKLSASDVAVAMCLLAWVLQEEELLDEAAAQIPSIKEGRHLAARLLLHRPRSEARRNLLFTLLRNPEQNTREVAQRMLERLKLSQEEYRKVEANVRYKKSQSLSISLLKGQESKELTACIGRLLQEPSEEAHMGALELSQYMKEKHAKDFEQVLPLLRAYEHPTEKEQLLLRELVGESHEVETILNTPGYGLYNPRVRLTIPEVKVDVQKAEHLFDHGESVCIHVLERLDALIGEHREEEYRDIRGEEQILGVTLAFYPPWYGMQKEHLKQFPFLELWEDFYQQEIKDPARMMEVYLYEICLERQKDYLSQKKLYQRIYGRVPFEKMVQGQTYTEQIRLILRVLFQLHVPDALKGHWGLVSLAKLFYVMGEPKKGHLSESYIRLPIFQECSKWLSYASGDWESAFALKYHIGAEIASYVQAYVKGIWNKDMLYRAFFEDWKLENLVQAVSLARSWGEHQYEGMYDLNVFFGRDYWSAQNGFDPRKEEKEVYALACELYKELIPLILKVELRRGEQETPFSKAAIRIQAVYGISHFLEILTALGKEPLKRGYGMYGTDRQTVLCHLLKVSYPNEQETGEDLKRALKGTSITRKRLVEAAMYAPQWIKVIQECLEIPAFVSGCYYFMAHTSEWLSDQRMAIVAKYTPLTREELSGGAFDIRWFFEAYEGLGEKDFKLLYDAAKYAAVSSAHARARKYADAALGKTTYEALTKEIDTKRNKDLLMSLGLLPLPEEKEEREAELFRRYQYILAYQKESRKFGAQRRASEKQAADMAFQNLSIHAGFTDVMRLRLRMEQRLFEEEQDYFSWQEVEDVRVRVVVDETGKSSVQCEREGKVLKSVPAKYKKLEVVVACQKFNKELKEQYRRTKKLLEQAMEDRTAFEVWELWGLLKHPVLRPLVATLVYRMAKGEGTVRMGFLKETGLEDWAGKVLALTGEEEVWIAHPLDFYQEGHWQEYQRRLFEEGIRQPFKQVFRELYVKLPEEMEKEESRLFSGYQIQPRKTVATLQGRRWVADWEDGLQKVYYRENVIAVIYAEADWFSPADIEAPTLQSVAFYRRGVYGNYKIREVPELIYSEVMRDVDLAVSTAYVGGVDPECSHSTVEMRKAVLRGNLRLFGLKNVRIQGNHAWIEGELGEYTVHLGSGVIHQVGNAMIHVVAVPSQYRGKVFLPFVDEDPKTAEIVTKIWMLAEDKKIKDPGILAQIR